jgi:hypothetical protein
LHDGSLVSRFERGDVSLASNLCRVSRPERTLAFDNANGGLRLQFPALCHSAAQEETRRPRAYVVSSLGENDPWKDESA